MFYFSPTLSVDDLVSDSRASENYWFNNFSYRINKKVDNCYLTVGLVAEGEDAIKDSIRLMVIARSEFNGKYDTIIDRESAFEILSTEIENKKAEEEAEKQAKIEQKLKEQQEKQAEKEKRAEEKAQREEERIRKQEEREAEKARKNSVQYKLGKAAERTANSALSQVGRKIMNELWKNIFKK